MNPWSLWFDPWETYLDAWSKALGGDIFRLHNSSASEDITARRSATPFRIALEGDNFALLDFSIGENSEAASPPTLIVTPYALHDWRVADLAHGHSLVETLRAQGVERLYVIAWKSANFKLRHNRIDAQFLALKSAIEHLGAPVQCVGLCQGGWLSITYAARFPDAFSRIALIGAPVDFKNSAKAIGAMDDALIDASINWLSLAGGGVIRGWSMQSLWNVKFGGRSDCCEALQENDAALHSNPDLSHVYREWDEQVLDLPPAYFGDVLKHLYRDNEILAERFKVLGECVSLKSITCPILIMLGRVDDVASEDHILALQDAVSTPRDQITVLQADCGHLALFLGRKTLQDQWPDIAHWLIAQKSSHHMN